MTHHSAGLIVPATGKFVCSVTQLCPALHNPMDCSPPGSSVHGTLQARIPEWVAISSSRGNLPTQGSSPHLLHLLHWQADILPLSHRRHTQTHTLLLPGVFLLVPSPNKAPCHWFHLRPGLALAVKKKKKISFFNNPQAPNHIRWWGGGSGEVMTV